MNSLPKTVTRQRRDCDLNPGHSVPDSSTLTTRLPSHPLVDSSVSLHTFKRRLKTYFIAASCTSVAAFFSSLAPLRGTKVCRYNWHSAGSLGWPFPMLKYTQTFHIKYMKAISSNSTRKLLWFEITKMLIAVKKNEFIVLCIIIFGTLSFPI